MRRAAAAAASVAPLLGVRALCRASDDGYYGGRSGIGERVPIEARGAATLAGSGVQRVTLLGESHETLRQWATEASWAEATRRHKGAYFKRSENLVQEGVVDRIRAHYQSCAAPRARPVQAALFRCDESTEQFASLRASTCTALVPELIEGTFDEKAERCIVDFANKRLGGGWLSYGMVQEEK
eukprot:2792439-Prymnesium_polylepis.1